MTKKKAETTKKKKKKKKKKKTKKHKHTIQDKAERTTNKKDHANKTSNRPQPSDFVVIAI